MYGPTNFGNPWKTRAEVAVVCGKAWIAVYESNKKISLLFYWFFCTFNYPLLEVNPTMKP